MGIYLRNAVLFRTKITIMLVHGMLNTIILKWSAIFWGRYGMRLQTHSGNDSNIRPSNKKTDLFNNSFLKWKKSNKRLLEKNHLA